MKKNVIIGTAGHVDHGKTCLVKALTGVDTDRLPEEKRRGVTIESGFAEFALPDGGTAGIVDVPGHERFIKNMLAGAGGIDIALLAVAADEGVMPQTVEHLELLRFLGIGLGAVAVTRADLADPERIRQTEEEIRKLTCGTFLENAPVILTSAVRMTGIRELKEALYGLAAAAEEKNDTLPFRLPIDRVFTLKGFGTIVTGTLTEGCMHVGGEAMLYPSGERVRLRTLQVHGREVKHARAGQRVAANLPGIARERISRGEILAEPESMKKTMMADVHLRLMKTAGRAVKNGSRVHLYHGAKELVCKVILAGGEALAPGQEGDAQLRMEEATALKAGDRFVIRWLSPVETIGGGTVLDPCPPKRRRKKTAAAEDQKTEDRKTEDRKTESRKTESRKTKSAGAGSLSEKEEASVRKKLEEIYREAGFRPPLTAEVKASFAGTEAFSPVFFSMIRDQTLISLDGKHYLHREVYEEAKKAIRKLWQEKGVVTTGEFRDALGISRKNAIAILEKTDREGFTRRLGDQRTPAGRFREK